MPATIIAEAPNIQGAFHKSHLMIFARTDDVVLQEFCM